MKFSIWILMVFFVACSTKKKQSEQTCSEISRIPTGGVLCREALAEPLMSLKAIGGEIEKPEEFRRITDPKIMEKSKAYVATETARARAFVESSPIYKALEARSLELSAKNPPLRWAFAGGELFVRAGQLFLLEGSAEKLILDPKKIDPSGETVVGEFKLSPDGKKIAVGLVTTGSDIFNTQIYELATGQKISREDLRTRMTGVTWDLQSEGVFYPRWPSQKIEDETSVRGQNFPVPVAYHKIGDSPNQDALVFEAPEKQQSMMFAVNQVADNLFIAHRGQGAAEIPLDISVGQREGSKTIWNRIRTSDVSKNYGKFIGMIGDKILLRSSEAGSNFGLVLVESKLPFQTEIFVPSSNSRVLLNAKIVGDKVITHWTDHSNESALGHRVVIQIYSQSGQLLKQIHPKEFGMESWGELSDFTGSTSSQLSYFSYSSLTEPTQTMSLNLNSLELKILPSGGNSLFDKSKINSKWVHYKSADGTKIPMRVYRRNDLKADPEFAYVFFYGAIGITNFSTYRQIFNLILDMGGMVAVPQIRGGGEYGMDWQIPSKLDRTQTLQDIAWASRWLKKTYKIKKNRVVISGRSFGGMHTYASLVHYYDDFSAFVPVVSVSDVSYFLETGHFGRFARDDFGLQRDQNGERNPSAQEKAILDRWSPLQNIAKLQHRAPKPIYAFTGSTDERVDSHQTYSMTFALQQMWGKTSVFLNEDKGGHTVRADYVRGAAFIAKTFGIETFDHPARP